SPQGRATQSGAPLQIPPYTPPPSIAHGALPRSSSSPSFRSGDRIVHKVRRGETLSSIASRYRVSVDELRRLNAIGPSGTIVVGERLVVSSGKRSTGGSGAKSASSGSNSGGGSSSSSGLTRYKGRQGHTPFP